jgi:two-component system, OmpR family, response regulator ChvI
LFVNDDVDTTAVIKEGLSMHGYEVETFVDPNLALQNFKESNYDLLLLDVRMRGLNGFELYNKMRKVDKNIKVCFISASNTFYEKYKRLYPEVQEKCYIQKPLRIKNLAGIIGKILVNNRLLQSHYLAKKNRTKIENR